MYSMVPWKTPSGPCTETSGPQNARRSPPEAYHNFLCSPFIRSYCSVPCAAPSIALTNKNIGPIAFDFDGAAVRVLKGLAQFPVEPYRIATRSYEANGIRIGLGWMVFGMPLLELVCIPILYS